MTMTPTQYAKQEFRAGRFPSMPVYGVGGAFYLCDNDWNILKGGKAYVAKDIAIADRSKILDRARAVLR
jgi:hypothetical protein